MDAEPIDGEVTGAETLPAEAAGPRPDDPEVEIIPATGPFSPEEEGQVVRWIGQGVNRNEIARRTGRGKATVTRVAQRHGLTFAPSDIAKVARERLASDNRARRVELGRLLLEDAHKMREQLWRPTEYLFAMQKTGEVVREKLREPHPGDKRNLMTAIGIAVTKIAELEALDTPNEGKEAIISLVDQLRVTQVNVQINEGGGE